MSIEHKNFLFLLFELIKRDVKARYIGSSLGFFWSFLQPILQLILFTFVFSYVLKISLIGERGVENFSLFLFCGLLPWMGIQEMLLRSTTVIVEQSSIIKKLPFPPEILLFSIWGSALFHQFIASIIFIIVLFAIGKFYFSFIFLPVLMFFEVFFISGFCFFFSSLYPFFRDVYQAVSYFCMIWFYITPIVYPLSLVPEKIKKILLLNPLTYLIESYRDIFLRGTIPGYKFYLIFLFTGFAILLFSYSMFNKLKKSFPDLV